MGNNSNNNKLEAGDIALKSGYLTTLGCNINECTPVALIWQPLLIGCDFEYRSF